MAMARWEEEAGIRSRSDVVKTSQGLMLYRIELLGGRGEIAGVEYHVSNRASHERWIFDNQADADWCFYEALRNMKVAGRA